MAPNDSSPCNAFFRYYLLVWGCLALLMAGLLLGGVGPKDFLLSESGPIELASAAGYLLCAIAIWRLASGWPGRWHAVVVMVLFALRELDFHSRFTSMNVSKIKFYLSPDVPVPEKLVGGAVVLWFFYAAYRLFRLEGRTWLDELLHRRACAYGVLFAMLCVVISKSLDGFARKLSALGLQVSAEAGTLASIFEEVLELGIPVMVGLAIFCYSRHGRG